ncbi:MAG: cation:proton antiporter [Pirellulaceae bacterium]
MNICSHLFLAAVPHEMWNSLTEILLLLGLAMILGAVAELLRQSAIVGYLLAGTIIGPSVLGLVSQQQNIFQIAELGVALLLFTIGLEFSVKRLVSLGKQPLLTGVLQVLLTLIAGALLSWGVGLQPLESIVVGAMIALSSTACVLRILNDRAEIDSPYGRFSLGILLVQDAAVVPLMLLVTMLTTGGTMLSIVWQLDVALASAVLLIATLYVFFTYAAPGLLKLTNLQRNRDLPILLALVMAMGSAWGAQRLGLSPALGAFVAGVLLGASPFAVQIRADIEPVKTILVTLFFAAVGMFGDAVWFFHHMGLVCTVVLAIVAGKVGLTFLAARMCGVRRQFAAATALCLAQVGEFSFVLATIAHGGGGEETILSDTTFRALVAATIISLLITPYLIAVAPRAGDWFEHAWRRRRRGAALSVDTPVDSHDASANAQPTERDWIFIMGFGPAGQRAAEDLLAAHQNQLVVIDMNTDNILIAERYGLMAHLGDATQSEILEHAGIRRASLIIITVPTPFVSQRLVHLARHHAPGAMIFARARYHMHRWQLTHAGAHVVVDEEDRVGHELAARIREVLREPAVD